MKIKQQNKVILLALSLCLFLIFCIPSGSGNENNNQSLVALLGLTSLQNSTSTCETNFVPSSNIYQQVCTPQAGKGRHFRLEGLRLNKTENSHGAFYFLIGQDSSVIGTTTTPSSTTRNGDGKFSFYHYAGGASNPVPYTYFTDGATAVYLTSDETGTGSALYNGFVNTATTICFDINESTPPRVTVWVSGMNGANCNNTSSLTLASAVWNKTNWSSNFAISDSGVVTVKASAATGVYLSKVFVSTKTAIE